MINFIKCFLLVAIVSSAPNRTIAQTELINCQELGLSFQVPTGFRVLDSTQLNALRQRGDKAIKESFNKESIKGWQPVCVNHQDSLKRTIMLNAITLKEAIAEDGNAEQFIAKTFKDANLFIIRRFKDRANIDVDEQSTVQQSELTIAGMKVRKNAFTFTMGSKLMFFARYYLFQKNGMIYLLAFTGSPKATDNEAIVQAIESAVHN